jgi:hypothetical protein
MSATPRLSVQLQTIALPEHGGDIVEAVAGARRGREPGAAGRVILGPPEVRTTTTTSSGSIAPVCRSCITAVRAAADEGSTKRPSSRASARWASKTPSSVIRTPAPRESRRALSP